MGKGGGEELRPVHGFCTQAMMGQRNSLLDFLNFLAKFLKITKTKHVSHNIIQVKLAINVAKIRKITYLCDAILTYF